MLQREELHHQDCSHNCNQEMVTMVAVKIIGRVCGDQDQYGDASMNAFQDNRTGVEMNLKLDERFGHTGFVGKRRM